MYNTTPEGKYVTRTIDALIDTLALQLLNPEIERELAGYSRDELTYGTYAILARKSAQRPALSHAGTTE